MPINTLVRYLDNLTWMKALDTAPPKSDRLTAKHLGQRAGEISARWAAGKQ